MWGKRIPSLTWGSADRLVGAEGHVCRVEALRHDPVVGRFAEVPLVVVVPVVLTQEVGEVAVTVSEIEPFDAAVNGNDEAFAPHMRCRYRRPPLQMPGPMGGSSGAEPKLASIQVAIDGSGSRLTPACRGRQDEDLHALQPSRELLCGDPHLRCVDRDQVVPSRGVALIE